MKRTITFFTVLLVFTLMFNGCEKDDSVSSSGLEGNYSLTYVTYYEQNVTFYAGQSNSYSGAVITLSGNLTMTESTYIMQMTVVSTVNNQTTTQDNSDQGTYTTNGNTMIISNGNGEVSNVTYSFDGDLLILSDGMMETGFSRQ